MKLLFVNISFFLLFATCNSNHESIVSKELDSSVAKSDIYQLDTRPEPGVGVPSYLFNNLYQIEQKKQKDARFEIAHRASIYLNNSFWVGDDIVYPNYYGGSFINSMGNLVIFVVGDTVRYKKDLVKRIGCSNFLIQLGQYNFDYLNDILTRLNMFYHNADNKFIVNKLQILQFRIEWNRVVVEMNDCTDEKVTLFKTLVLDSPALTFKYPKATVTL